MDRPAAVLWRSLFTNACDAAPDIDWKHAGFARCESDEVERVTKRLKDIIHSTNAAFAVHLAEADREERVRLLEEGINFISSEPDARGWRIGI